MTTVKNIYDMIDRFAPFSSQCEWDNSGILVGDGDVTVTKALVCLDLNDEALKIAKHEGCQLIVTHHPVIFSPLKSVSFDGTVARLCKENISVISAHTNFDKAKGGVNDTLCEILGLTDVSEFGEDNLARIGELGSSMTDKEFAGYVSKRLGAYVKFVPSGRPIKKVAVCGGAGADFMYSALSLGADALVTADTKHHELLFARDNGFCLVDAGHYATENPAMRIMCEYLIKNFKEVQFFLYDGIDPAEYINC